MMPIRKAYAYIIRELGEVREFLVFRHRDDPEAGFQIPKGTMLPHQAPEAAVLREAFEETGPRGLVVLRPLAVDLQTQPDGSASPDAWEHTVSGEGDDNGLVFCYSWARSAVEVNLWPTFGDYLHLALPTPGAR